MTDAELLALDERPDWTRVIVKANDYEYEGWLVSVFAKRKEHPEKAMIRCVVEDDNGRLFIHNAGQLTEKK